ncbi:MAG: hypothetical protein EOO97_00210 [Pedobacter sp.]|nr:MAG: hypothetical protein EOO97_00210 [Pedobacter sp.]
MLKSLLIFISCSFALSIIAQSNLPNYGQKGLVSTGVGRQQMEWEERTNHNRSLKPDELSDRFRGLLEDNERLFISSGVLNESDEVKKAILRRQYGHQAESLFDEAITKWALFLLSVTILLSSLSKPNVLQAVSITAAIGTLSYLLFAYIGGNLADFQLMVELTWLKALGLIIAISVINLLWIQLRRHLDRLQLAQRIIVLLGIGIGSAMLASWMTTSALGPYAGEQPFFNITENKLNWSCCAFLVLTAAFLLFQKRAAAKQ